MQDTVKPSHDLHLFYTIFFFIPLLSDGPFQNVLNAAFLYANQTLPV